MQLDTSKIDALHKHFSEDGGASHDIIGPILGLKKHEKTQIQSYVAAVVKRYPDSYEQAEEPVITPEVIAEIAVASVASVVGVEYFILGANNIPQALTVVSERGNRIIFKVTEPEDKVTIMLRGASQFIDLYQLRKPGAVSTFEGVSVATLIMLGELSKGE